MSEWRLYYDNGDTFSDTDGAPHESPEWGCVAVVDRGVVLFGANADYFLYRTDLVGWHQVGETAVEGRVGIGLVDHLTHFGHLISCIRPARWTADNDNFKAIYARAVKDAAGE